MSRVELTEGCTVRLRNGTVIDGIVKFKRELYGPQLFGIGDDPCRRRWRPNGQYYFDFVEKADQFHITHVKVGDKFRPLGAKIENEQADVIDEECSQLYATNTAAGGLLRLMRWPEGHVLWHHGRIVWKSWETADPVPIPPLSLYGLHRAFWDSVSQATCVTAETSAMINDGLCGIHAALQEAARLATDSAPKQEAVPEIKGGLSGLPLAPSTKPRWNVCGPKQEAVSPLSELHETEKAIEEPPVKLFLLDNVEPITRAFLQSLHPGDPLRAIEVIEQGADSTKIEITYGRPLNTAKKITLDVSADMPLWIKPL